MAPPIAQQDENGLDSAVMQQEIKTSIIDQMAQIPRFTGTDIFMTIDKFQKTFEEWANWLKWGEDDKFFVLKKKLEGKAADILDVYEDSIKTSQELFDKLREKLSIEISATDKLKSLWAFRQTPEMTVTDFISLARRKAIAAAKAHKSTRGKVEETAEEWLLNTLFENILPQYRRDLLRKKPKTSQEFEEMAILEEQAWKKTNDINIPGNIMCAALTPNNDKLIQMLESMDRKMQNLTLKVEKMEQDRNEGTRKEDNNKIICFRCNRHGHIARECRVDERNLQQNYFRGRGGNNTFRGAPHQNRYDRGGYNNRNNQHQNFRGGFRGRGRGFQGNNKYLN